MTLCGSFFAFSAALSIFLTSLISALICFLPSFDDSDCNCSSSSLNLSLCDCNVAKDLEPSSTLNIISSIIGYAKLERSWLLSMYETKPATLFINLTAPFSVNRPLS